MIHNYEEYEHYRKSKLQQPFERKFASQIRRSKCSFRTNTLPNIKRRQELKNRADVIRYSNEAIIECHFSNAFIPMVHSTPNATMEAERGGCFLKKQIKIHPNVPTISDEVDRNQPNYIPVPSKYIVNERNIKAKRWILKLCSNEPVKVYLAQLGYVLLVLTVLTIVGTLLICYSKYLVSMRMVHFANYTNEADMNWTNEDYRTYEAETNCSRRNATTTVRPLKKKAVIKFEKINLCECKNPEDICMVENAYGIPVCRQAVDLKDPTGCGGLCALEIEACHLLHANYSVFTCRALHNKPTCKSDEWQCENTFCIPATKRCDGLIDCYDHSDEEDCRHCDLTQNFQCGNRTSCLDKDRRCDGIVDCWDGFDEHNCSDACSELQFTCQNGECIDLSSFCDTYHDCSDGSDEFIGCKKSCGSEEFKCLNRRCVPKSQRCNRFDNCGDMSDELQCAL